MLEQPCTCPTCLDSENPCYSDCTDLATACQSCFESFQDQIAEEALLIQLRGIPRK